MKYNILLVVYAVAMSSSVPARPISEGAVPGPAPCLIYKKFISVFYLQNVISVFVFSDS